MNLRNPFMNNILNLSIVFSILITLAFKSFSQSNGEIDNMRSDTLDVIEYQMKMDLTAMSSQNLKASCKVTFESKMNGIDGISLDLLQLTVDSVQWNEIGRASCRERV